MKQSEQINRLIDFTEKRIAECKEQEEVNWNRLKDSIESRNIIALETAYSQIRSVRQIRKCMEDNLLFLKG